MYPRSAANGAVFYQFVFAWSNSFSSASTSQKSAFMNTSLCGCHPPHSTQVASIQLSKCSAAPEAQNLRANRWTQLIVPGLTHLETGLVLGWNQASAWAGYWSASAWQQVSLAESQSLLLGHGGRRKAEKEFSADMYANGRGMWHFFSSKLKVYLLYLRERLVLARRPFGL